MLGHSIIPLQQNNVSVLFSREDVVKSVLTQPFFFYYISQCVCCLNLLSRTTCHLHLALICRAKLFEFTEYYLNRLCFVLFRFDLFALGNVGLECNLFVCF